MFAQKQYSMTFQGKPVTLAGHKLRIGDPAPEYQAVGPAFAPLTLADTEGCIRLVLTMPSLDAPNCDQAIQHYSTALADIGEAMLLVASMDLPFTQARWRAASGHEDVFLLSDYQQGSLGKAFGVLIEEMRLLAPAVFIINERNRIAYSQYGREVMGDLDYTASLLALRMVVNSPLRRPGG
jgi:thioredoxin-dependent peroxiredoxin